MLFNIFKKKLRQLLASTTLCLTELRNEHKMYNISKKNYIY